MSIDYQALAKAGGIGKGVSRKRLKARKDRADAKQLKAFRQAVWQREREKNGIDASGADEWAYCQRCGIPALRHTADMHQMGHVHHYRSRRHKGTRYDPNNGVLLCAACHDLVHRKLIEL